MIRDKRSNGGRQSKELNSVQMLRGIAAGSVALSHAFAAASLPKYVGVELLGGWPAIGRAGVELFFVLSGFLMYTIHWRDFSRPDRAPRYLLRRAIRIYPVYWVYVTIAILALVKVAPRNDSPFDYLTIYSLWRFTGVQLPLGVAWTLFHEIAFYVLFVVLVIDRRFGLFAFVMWFSVCVYLRLAPGPNWVSVTLSEINILFCFGIVLGWIFKRTASEFGGLILTVGAIGYVGVFWLFELHRSQPETLVRTIGYGVFGCLILYGMLSLELKGRFKAVAGLIVLGDASYTVYLLHYPIISLLLKAVLILGLLKLQPAELVVVAVVAVAAVAVALAAVAYVIVERPLQRWLYRAIASSAKYSSNTEINGHTQSATQTVSKQMTYVDRE